MPKPARSKIPSLDGVRALSIIIVFIDHADLPQIIRGSTGVTIFFFLSGYLITTLMLGEQDATGRISVSGFYIRRALRIFPAMYLALAAAIVIGISGVVSSTLTTGGSIASAFHLTNYWIIFEGREGIPPGMNALWSLAVEEHYYVLFPLFFILILRKLSRGQQIGLLVSFCTIELIWRSVLHYMLGASFDRLYLATDTRLDSILFGALMAVAFNPVRGRRLFKGKIGSGPLVLIGLSLFAVARVIPTSSMMVFGPTAEGIGLIFIFTALISQPSTWYGRILNSRPIAYLGLISYAFYLDHRLILILVDHYAGLGVWPDALLSFVLATGAAMLIFHYVERPVQGLRARFGHQSRPTVAEYTS